MNKKSNKTISPLRLQFLLDPLLRYLRRIKFFSIPGALFLSLLLDFSIWVPLFCKITALILQAAILGKLLFEEKYIQVRFRRLSWKKRLIPIVLFGVALLFYVEKILILYTMWGALSGVMIAPYRLYGVIFIVSSFFIYVLRINTITRFISRLHLRPAQTLSLGFMGLIILGTLLLSLPQMVSNPADISILDAFFTATSASTVTGLALFPISDYYRPTGLAVILFLMQLGGLGIMTFGVLFSLLSRQRMRLNDAVALQGVLETESLGSIRKDIQLIFVITLTVESIGAFFLWVFLPEGSVEPVFMAIFHAVSAFCNAGFALFSTNLEGYIGNYPVNLTIAILIFLGGIGFPVLNNLGKYPLFSKERTTWRLSFHSRMVLSISAGLLLFGTIGIYVLEYGGVLATLSWHEKWLAAFFQSVTARTAGFNTLNFSDLSDATLFLLILLMWIGGSPASTAGGIKTTTFGVMLATLGAMLKQREEVNLFKRSLPSFAIQKSLAITFTSSALMAFLLLLLLATEDGSFKALMFESVSAFNTVGFSTGITSQLSPFGKIIIILTMFVGRIGPLTLAFSLAGRASKGKYAYPRERVIIG